MKEEKYKGFIRVKPGENICLKDCPTGWAQTEAIKTVGREKSKDQAGMLLEQDIAELAQAQHLLYADDRYSILIVFQAMDAAGKDGTIKHVMSGINPQGCQVFSFKQPSAEELNHNFLWRYMKSVPERGRIGIFNRSYYEDVLIVKVHPELLQKLPDGKKDQAFWDARYQDINAFEQHLARNGTVIIKFFLHVSKKVQKERFIERLDRPEKNWKFSASDLIERERWDDYMKVYEEAINITSTEWAPWHIIPADDKWAMRAAVADIITTRLHNLDLSYPRLTEIQIGLLAEARKQLENE
jgi:PPK2 family polyphosphate:nucleotide phosphotransferase